MTPERGRRMMRTFNVILSVAYAVAFARVVVKISAFEVNSVGGAVLCLVFALQCIGHARIWTASRRATAAIAVLGSLLMIPYLLGLYEQALVSGFWVRFAYTSMAVLVAVLCVVNAMTRGDPI
jgi:hypothetical protein